MAADHRLPRDHYVRVASNDYSVHPSVVGRRVNIVAGPNEVVVCCAGHEVARHGRCWAAHQTITDPAHRDAAAALRAPTVWLPPLRRSPSRSSSGR